MGLYMKMIALGSIVLFGVIWIFAVVPGMISSQWFQALNPIEQYGIYNTGVYIILVGMIGGVISLALSGRVEPISMAVDGFSAFLIFATLDLWQPPMAIGQDGTFLYSTQGAMLGGTSIDYAAGWTFQQIGFSGGSIYALTYIILPIMFIVVAVLVFGLNRFLSLFGEGL
jgi:hypothetical protein